MNNFKLEPCPFCGGKAIFNVISNTTNHCSAGFGFEVECEDCGMKLPNRYSLFFTLAESGEINILNDGRKEATARWNRRVSDGRYSESNRVF